MSTVIKPDLLAAAQTNFSTRFQAGVGSYVAWWKSHAMEMPSQTSEEVYAWLQKLPGLRLWAKGTSRKVNRLGANAYRLRNETFEDTVAVDVDDFEDDRLGIYGPMFEMLGHSVSRFPDLKVAEAILLGTSALCFDGLSFFNAAHPVDMNDASKGTYSNSRTGVALNEANLISGLAAFANFRDESGERIGLKATQLIVPTSLAVTARKLVEATTVLSGGAAVDNVMRGIATVYEIPELESEPTVWYLAASYGPLKPLIYQNRSMGSLVAKTKPDDDNVFNTNELVWGIKARAAFGYSLPYLMVRNAA